MPDAAPDQAGDAGLEQEFDVLMARADLTVPPDRRDALLAGFKDLRAQVALLRQPRTAAAEPSNIFVLRPAGAVS